MCLYREHIYLIGKFILLSVNLLFFFSYKLFIRSLIQATQKSRLHSSNNRFLLF